MCYRYAPDVQFASPDSKVCEQCVPLFDRSVDALGLKVWTLNRLRRMGIVTVGELCACTEEHLSVQPQFGVACTQDVVMGLARLGLGLRAAPSRTTRGTL